MGSAKFQIILEKQLNIIRIKIFAQFTRLVIYMIVFQYNIVQFKY